MLPFVAVTRSRDSADEGRVDPLLEVREKRRGRRPGDAYVRIVRPYDDTASRSWELDDRTIVDHPRTFADLFTTFQRSNFRVDQVIEPTASSSPSRDATYADLMRTVPATLLLRARKQGN